MRCKLDPYVCNLLEINCYRTYQSLKDIEDADIVDIEDFVSSGKIMNHLQGRQISHYLGSATDFTKFSFLPGEKKFLKKIILYVQANHSECNKALGSWRN